MNNLTTSTGTLFVISAPSGAGKTSLVRALLESMTGIDVSVSHTTRDQRPGEIPGQDYHFVGVDEFQAMIHAGAFLEHAEVFGRYYGTAQAQVEQQLASGRDVILEIDWQGARQVRRLMPGCVSIFILPPSRSILEQRMRKRGQDSDAVIANRMQSATDEMSHYGEFDYLLVNNDFDLALTQISAIVESCRCQTGRQTLRLAQQLTELLAD
jgi:guanylate kinase